MYDKKPYICRNFHAKSADVVAIVVIILVYFAVLLLLSSCMGTRGNDAFFRGNRQSPWPIVAFGMIGASVSGVTFVSVPGMPMRVDMTYLQMCMGFVVGYLVVAFVLLPLYYRAGLTSIYGYLGDRFGRTSRKTGAWFFLLSKLAGSAAKFYLVCLILQQVLHVPFVTIVIAALLMVWLYTRRSGIRVLVWTDALQTFCMLMALVLMMVEVTSRMGLSSSEACRMVWTDAHSRVFEWTDWSSPQHFVKQFVSGIFVVIVMTGLDQDMMQKNLTCRSLRAGQKNLYSYGVMFIPVNLLFLALGVLFIHFYARCGVELPQSGDELVPQMVFSGELSPFVTVCFAIGVIAAAFSSADSALTALTTSFCIDIMNMEGKRTQTERKVRLRHWVHVGMTLVFVLFVLAFKWIGSQSVIDLIYTLVGYTYGPLLGLFAFGLLSRRLPRERWVPFVAVAAPVLCYVVDHVAQWAWGYRFGYELLLLNGLLTYAGLYGCSLKAKS